MACCDILAVIQENGTIKTTPFFMRFPKKSKQSQKVFITIGTRKIDDVCLTLNKDDDVPHFTNSPKTPKSPPTNDELVKRTWRDTWLDRVESEIKFSVEDLSPSKEITEKLGLTRAKAPIHFETEDGTMACHAHIFLWHYDDKIIISDIDGTITKSDVRGHLFTKLGYSYAHDGIAKLYTRLVKNNYRIIYLTSRPVAQLSDTKDYIFCLEQHEIIQHASEGKKSFIASIFAPSPKVDDEISVSHKMPQGPVFVSYNNIMNAMIREVVLRKPHVFKIQVLKNLQALFGPNAFVAGFGNRETDDMSYAAVGAQHCFRIDKSSKLLHIESKKLYKGGYNDIFEEIDNYLPLWIKPEVPENVEANENPISLIVEEEEGDAALNDYIPSDQPHDEIPNFVDEDVEDLAYTPSINDEKSLLTIGLQQEQEKGFEQVKQAQQEEEQQREELANQFSQASEHVINIPVPAPVVVQSPSSPPNDLISIVPNSPNSSIL